MQPPTIDLRGVTTSHLQPTDNPVLAHAVGEAIEPATPMVDGRGFDNRL